MALAGAGLMVGQPWTEAYGQTAGIPPTRVPPVVTALVGPDAGSGAPADGQSVAPAPAAAPAAGAGGLPAPPRSGGVPVAAIAQPPARLVWDGAGALQLAVPTGALVRPTRLAIAEVAAGEVPPPPAGLRFGTTIRRIGAEGAAHTEAPAQPLGLMVRFTPEDLAAAGGLPAGLRLLLLPPGGSAWTELPTKLEAAGGLLQGEMSGWGIVAVAGVIPQLPTPARVEDADRQGRRDAESKAAAAAPDPAAAPLAWLALAAGGAGVAVAALALWRRYRSAEAGRPPD